MSKQNFHFSCRWVRRGGADFLNEIWEGRNFDNVVDEAAVQDLSFGNRSKTQEIQYRTNRPYAWPPGCIPTCGPRKGRDFEFPLIQNKKCTSASLLISVVFRTKIKAYSDNPARYIP